MGLIGRTSDKNVDPRARLQAMCDLADDEMDILTGRIPVSPEIAEHLIENVIGYFPIPFGVATGFVIDGRETLVPMANEDSAVISALSTTAKWIAREGSIRTYAKGNLIIGQIQLPNVLNVALCRQLLHTNREHLIDAANAVVPGLVARGGGIRDLALREIARPSNAQSGGGTMLVIHVLCDPCDAMGANLINQVCEALKPKVESLTGERVGLCILSNLVDTKLAVAEVILRDLAAQNAPLAQAIIEGSQLARLDGYRAAMQNQQVLGAIDPILIATGNDWRAVEAGVHAYAARSGAYEPVTQWEMQGSDLVGRIEVPLAVGTVGGVTKLHPMAAISLKMIGATHADELARICAAVGLVRNLSTLTASAGSPSSPSSPSSVNERPAR